MTPKDAFPWYGLFIGHGAHSWCNPGKSLPPAGMHHLPPLENGDRCGVAVWPITRGRSGGSLAMREKPRKEVRLGTQNGTVVGHPVARAGISFPLGMVSFSSPVDVLRRRFSRVV